MPRVVTNQTALAFAKEATLGVLPGSPEWHELEPNSIGAFGTTVSKTARSPISRSRARRKGTVTDADSTVEFEADLTLTHLRQFAESFLFARAVGGDVLIPTAVTGVSYTVPAISAATAGRLFYGAAAATTLVYARGFANAANNGLKPLTADPAAGATAITVAGLTAEAVDVTDEFEVAIAGVRAAVGDLQIDADGNLTSAALNFTTLGLTVGQQVHVGGVDITHQFATAANTGFARVTAIAANKLTLAKKDTVFVADNGAGIAVDLLFGQFVRNVDVDHVDFLEQPLQFELTSPNLMDGGVTGYEYATGFIADALSVELPLTGKATLGFGFIGQNTTDPSSVRALNAALAKSGGQTAAFGTANDLARLRIRAADEEGLTTDFKSATLTISNNVSGEKVLGRLGAKYLNAGNLEVDVESSVLFTNPDVIHAIKCNHTVGLDWVLRNGDGGAAFDLPTGTLDGGGREYPENESVTMSTTFAAHQEEPLGFSLGISFFPALPPQPC